jgi:hypothetical protein
LWCCGLEYFSSLFLSHKGENKSPRGFEKWTFLKMSKNEKPKIVLKKGSFSEVSEHNALNFVFLGEKTVTIKFNNFLY